MKRYFHPEFTTDRPVGAKRCFLPHPDALAMAQADGDVINVLDMLTEGIPASCVEESDLQGALSVRVEVPKLADALLQVENQEQQAPSRLQRVVEEWANWADAAIALRMLAPASVELTWATNEPAPDLRASSDTLFYQLCARSNRLAATMSDLRAAGLLSPQQYDSDTAIELWVESEAEVRTIFNTNAEHVQTLGSDNEILLLQIALLQEELEANYTEQQKLRAAHKTEVTELKEANERLQRDNANDTIKLSEVGAKTKELELEVEVQLLQIAQLQEELEYYFTKVKAAEDEKAAYNEVETAPSLSMARALISRLFKAETAVAES